MTSRAIAMNTEYPARPQRKMPFAGESEPLVVTKRRIVGAAQSGAAPLLSPLATRGGLEQALAMESSALPAALWWHACAMHIGQQLFCLYPWHSACFELQHRIIAAHAEQRWPHYSGGTIRRMPATDMAPLAQECPTEEELARSMDIALGVHNA
jgi:hypothetical protein